MSKVKSVFRDANCTSKPTLARVKKLPTRGVPGCPAMTTLRLCGPVPGIVTVWISPFGPIPTSVRAAVPGLASTVTSVSGEPPLLGVWKTLSS